MQQIEKNGENSPQYTLVESDRVKEIPSIFISQKDVRAIQLGKAAVITGIEFLSRAAGYLRPEKIIVAGAFGSYIDKADMITIGMLPEMGPEKIENAGNAAGAGAVMVLCEEAYYRRSIEMAETVTTVELATDIGFQEVFVKKLGFLD